LASVTKVLAVIWIGLNMIQLKSSGLIKIVFILALVYGWCDLEAQSPVLIFDDGADGQSVELNPSETSYAGTHSLGESEFGWNFNVDAHADDGLLDVVGSFKIKNTSTATRSYSVELLVPLKGHSSLANVLSGSINHIKLVMDHDGGQASCQPGASHAFSGIIDSAEYVSTLACPFTIGGSGAGVASLSSNALNFGNNPLPSKISPDVSSSFGFRLEISLTAGDELTLTTSYFLGGDVVSNEPDDDSNEDQEEDKPGENNPGDGKPGEPDLKDQDSTVSIARTFRRNRRVARLNITRTGYAAKEDLHLIASGRRFSCNPLTLGPGEENLVVMRFGPRAGRGRVTIEAESDSLLALSEGTRIRLGAPQRQVRRAGGCPVRIRRVE